VLAAEIVQWLAPAPDRRFVDATVGLGGHTAALLEAGAAFVLGLDRDPHALSAAAARLERFGDRVALVHADYRDLPQVLRSRGLGFVDGIVMDLGVSSLQLDDPARGFSFRQPGPLDMRMDPTRGPTLAARLQDVDEPTLADVIWRYGEERRSRRIARAIVRLRDRGGLADTSALASVVRAAAGGRGRQRLDPATRTFQALRIWLNDELSGLGAALDSAVDSLAPGGRLAVIAFHSLEDRVVKQTFRSWAEAGRVRLLTRKPLRPGEAEIARNPRARSARLRVVEKAA
jgi:16S rRNA (cytosine1402-N4)-methyltransferase